jgi:hypothetical protein
MGAPCWSVEEREYFVNVILPMSKYAGGSYSQPEGLGWGELAEIMQEELDRKGVSRRRYTSDMLFQHYYQKVSDRSYKRGEGDSMIVPSSSPPPKSGRMNPPPCPTPKTQPATKKPSNNMIYASKSIQTHIAIEPDSESERNFQQYSRYDGPLTARYDAPVSRANLEVQPDATSSRKRKYQATVDDARDDGDVNDYDFILKDERFEVESPRFRKKKTLVARVLGSETRRNRAGEDVFNNIDKATELLGARSRSPFGGDRRFNSPSPGAHSESTSTIAWKTYTPTPSFEPPSSISDTSRLLRPSMVDALLEERSRPLSRASDRSDRFQVISPERGSPRTLAAEEVATRRATNIIRSPGVGPSRNAYNYRRDSVTSDSIRSPTYSPRRESSGYAELRKISESSAINRHEYALPRGTPSIDGDYYPASRPATPSGPTHYQGSSVSKEDRYHGDGQGHDISPSSFTARPVTPSLPNFRIRKRSKLEPSASFE